MCLPATRLLPHGIYLHLRFQHRRTSHNSSVGTQPQEIIEDVRRWWRVIRAMMVTLFCQIRGDLGLTVTSRHFWLFCWTPIKKIFEVACEIIPVLIDDLAFSRFYWWKSQLYLFTSRHRLNGNFSRITLRELFAFETFTKLIFFSSTPLQNKLPASSIDSARSLELQKAEWHNNVEKCYVEAEPTPAQLK